MASNPLANLLSHLVGVREIRSGQFYARCPAHDDRSPSLSIHDTGDKILIHCFAECKPDAVLAAIGLTFSDLYPEDKWKAAREAGISAGGQESSNRITVDPLELERTVLRVAESMLKRREPLTVEDIARVQLAMERLGIEEVA